MGELLDNVLKWKLGGKEVIRVVFKKTITLPGKNYENEVIEVETTLEIDKPITGMERSLLETLLISNLEMTVYAGLYCRQIISSDEYKNRVEMIEYNIRSIHNRVKELNPSFDIEEYFLSKQKDVETGIEMLLPL